MGKKSEQIKQYVEGFWNANCFASETLDFFAENVTYQTIIGKRVGRRSFVSHAADWAYAFPDVDVTIASLEERENTVCATFLQKGTHLNPYRDSCGNSEAVLTKTSFWNFFVKAPPSMRKTENRVDWVFVFDHDKVSRIFARSDELDFNTQLGMAAPTTFALEEQGALQEFLSTSLDATLSSREFECVALAFCSFSAKHIGEILGRSHRTIEVHLQNAYQKLGCYGKQQCLDMMHANQTLTLWWDLGRLICKRKFLK